MIQAAMYFVLGVLTAGLLALAVTPAIWRRAIRLTRARLEASVPMTFAEIKADKDQLRAEFAVANRRLEMALASLEGRAAEQAVEVNRYRAEAARLGGDLQTKVETIQGLEARVADLDQAVKAAEARIVAARAELAQRDETLAERTARLKALEGDFNAAVELSDAQKLELVARDTEIGNLKDQLAASRSAEEAIGKVRDELAAELAMERARLAAAEFRGEGLEARIAAFEAERVDRLAALERRADEIKGLEARLADEAGERRRLAEEIARLMAERDIRLGELAETAGAMASLRAEIAEATAERRRIEARLADTEAALAAAQATIAVLEDEGRRAGDAVAAGDNLRKAIAAAEEEKAALEARLQAIEASHAALLAENVELRRVGGLEWTAERDENARLRERLAAIAADVAVMMQAPPGEHPAAAGNGNGSAHPEGAAAAGGSAEPVRPAIAAEAAPPRPIESRTLAERIRALQHAASRQSAAG